MIIIKIDLANLASYYIARGGGIESESGIHQKFKKFDGPAGWARYETARMKLKL